MRDFRALSLELGMISRDGEEDIERAVAIAKEINTFRDSNPDPGAVYTAVELIIERHRRSRMSWPHLRGMLGVLYDYLRVAPPSPATGTGDSTIGEELATLEPGVPEVEVEPPKPDSDPEPGSAPTPEQPAPQSLRATRPSRANPVTA